MNRVVKVLFLAADTAEDEVLRIDREIRDVTDAVRKGRGARALEIVPELAVRPGELQLAIERHDPDVVHFSGHGAEDLGIVMDDGSQVRPDALRRMFRGFPGVRLVVLNACDTLPIARALVKVLDYAVGMKGLIEDRASIAFSAAFYDALASGQSVPTAFGRGTAQIQLMGIHGVSIPKLCEREGVPPDPLGRPRKAGTRASSAPGGINLTVRDSAQVRNVNNAQGNGTTFYNS